MFYLLANTKNEKMGNDTQHKCYVCSTETHWIINSKCNLKD